MKITEEKRIISKIDFTETEVQFLNDLSDIITTCCENNPASCETCPFGRTANYSGVNCNDVANFLGEIACYKKVDSANN